MCMCGTNDNNVCVCCIQKENVNSLFDGSDNSRWMLKFVAFKTKLKMLCVFDSLYKKL